MLTSEVLRQVAVAILVLAGPYVNHDSDSTGTSPPAAPVRTYALHELGAAGILLDPAARSAYEWSLGPLRREPWLAKLDGPSPQNVLITVAGTEYLLASACKTHDCADNNIVLLYSAARGVLYGKVYQSGEATLVGAPSPAMAKELDRLWREQFRGTW
jgi:hypothetical protein